MEVNALEPISLKFDDVVDDQHAAYGKNCYYNL